MLFNEFGELDAATTMYQRLLGFQCSGACLDLQGELLDIPESYLVQVDDDVRVGAAHNLSLLYQIQGLDQLAQQVLDRFLTVG